MRQSGVVAPPVATPLQAHVSLIGCRRSEPEMPSSLILDALNDINSDGVIPNASRVIAIRAIMADILPPCWPVTRRQEPCSLRHRDLGFAPIARTHGHDHPVSRSMMTAESQPARIRLDDARPETDIQRRQRVHLCTMPARTERRAVLDNTIGSESGVSATEQARAYGRLSRHRDLSLTRNRGAGPRLLTQVRGLCVARILP